MKVEWVPIREVLELQRRAVNVFADSAYQEIGVRSFGRGLFIKPPLVGVELGAKRVFEIREGDFIVSNVFGWEGAVGVAGPEHDGLIGSHRFMTWTPRQDADVEYLRQYFGSKPGLSSLANSSPGSAGRNRTLSIKNFEQILIPLPSRADQCRIANHLSELETMIRGTGRPSVSLSPQLPHLLGSVIDETTTGEVSIREICQNQQIIIHPGDDIRDARDFIGLEHIESHTGRRIGGRAVGDESGRKMLFAPGQITYGYLRPYLNKVWVADRIGLCSVEQFTLVPAPEVDPMVLSVVLRSNAVWMAAQAATNGLQLPRLSLRSLMSFKVPDIRGLAWASISNKVESLTEFVVRQSLLTKHGEGLRNAILPAARNEIFSAMR